MSASSAASPVEAAASVSAVPSALKGRHSARWWILVGSALGLVVISAVRVATGATDLTSAGTIGAALALWVPIAMAGLGGLWSERAGVANIGLEGMMILGTFGAGWLGWQHGPWVGLVCAVIFGALGGLIHAVATVTFGVDHIVSGVAVNILALGGTQFLASQLLQGTPGGGSTQSPHIPEMGSLSVPGANALLGPIERHGWFLISDLAGIVRGLTYQISPITLLAVALFVLSGWVLWRTPFGLRLRACGEEPHAAESLGVNVYFYKYVAVIVSGALSGVGGAFLAIALSGIYREGQTAGRGYIGLAAMIFGNWRPGGLAAGAGLFGFIDAMQLRNANAVHGLLLVVALLALAGAAWAWYRKARLGAAVALVVGVAVLYWFSASSTLPPQVTAAAPYLTTLLVLSFASQSLRMPKADGQVYRRGESR